MYLENVRKRFRERYFSDLSNTRHLHRRLANCEERKVCAKIISSPGSQKISGEKARDKKWEKKWEKNVVLKNQTT